MHPNLGLIPLDQLSKIIDFIADYYPESALNVFEALSIVGRINSIIGGSSDPFITDLPAIKNIKDLREHYTK